MYVDILCLPKSAKLQPLKIPYHTQKCTNAFGGENIHFWVWHCTIMVLGFLPNISRENGNFKINGLSASEIYVDGVKLSDLSELNNIPGETPFEREPAMCLLLPLVR